MRTLIRKTDKWLLQHKPEIWLTKIHWIFLLFIIVFAVENSSAGDVFLFGDPSYILFILFSIMVLPVVFWIRFQFTCFIPFFNYSQAYRIFLFNVLGLLIFFMMIYFPIINNNCKYDNILNEYGKKNDEYILKLAMFDDESIASLLQYSKSREGYSKFEALKADDPDLLDVSKFNGFIYKQGAIYDSQANAYKYTNEHNYIFDTAVFLANMNIFNGDYSSFKNTSNKLYKLYHIQPLSKKQKLTISLYDFIKKENNQYITDLSNEIQGRVKFVYSQRPIVNDFDGVKSTIWLFLLIALIYGIYVLFILYIRKIYSYLSAFIVPSVYGFIFGIMTGITTGTNQGTFVLFSSSFAIYSLLFYIIYISAPSNKNQQLITNSKRRIIAVQALIFGQLFISPIIMVIIFNGNDPSANQMFYFASFLFVANLFAYYFTLRLFISRTLLPAKY